MLGFVANRRGSDIMNFNPRTATAPIPPALVAAALDCLAFLPDGTLRLEPSLLTAITRKITTNTRDADALLVRIRAAAIIFGDPRWQTWSTHFRASTPEMYRAFDAVMLDCVATLPLDASLKFCPDEFFDALLGGTPLMICN
jgi:hypothetical protein